MYNAVLRRVHWLVHILLSNQFNVISTAGNFKPNPSCNPKLSRDNDRLSPRRWQLVEVSAACTLDGALRSSIYSSLARMRLREYAYGANHARGREPFLRRSAVYSLGVVLEKNN